ncbi:MAG: LysE family transporter [Chlorobium sp.]|jgi:threonine/homoserine/homoserine lactone efflux protein|uniref:LysE family translocator n=1 Tax=Chlorobium sp. TaxID=1095 RepID=UPI001DB6FA61|nr:LysE family transporter [Chlorobium sp.]MBN1279114.1 LysE family transporter [Chlorobiaceae bacterium]MCF8215875.1 LysE family transporter [Chlorobium sp.]MCF8270773.1 LysE family transporter [Chlorobium sp.]MCF8287085.1 LysE family transporter [Chlorobium sp.]MCF8290742.1 LysE family transporter [Chlorobium sp.]
MLTYLIWGIGYGFAAAMQPGQFQAYLMAQTLRQGWRKTLPMIFAPLLSDGPVIVIVLLALSRLPVWWLQVLRFAGGLFALYLAAGTFRAWRDFQSMQENPPSGVRQNLFRAVLVNLLNPGPYLFWSLVTGPLLLSGWKVTPLHGIGLLAGFYVTIMVTLAGFIMLLSGSGKLGPRANRFLLGISGLALAAFGIFQIFSTL